MMSGCKSERASAVWGDAVFCARHRAARRGHEDPAVAEWADVSVDIAAVRTNAHVPANFQWSNGAVAFSKTRDAFTASISDATTTFCTAPIVRHRFAGRNGDELFIVLLMKPGFDDSDYRLSMTYCAISRRNCNEDCFSDLRWRACCFGR